MTDASAHFASCCCAMVLPVPNAPGMVAVPPFAIGKKKSMMRWPVSRGVLLGSCRLKPLAVRTGQVFSMNSEMGQLDESSSPTGYEAVEAAAMTMDLILTERQGGIING